MFRGGKSFPNIAKRDQIQAPGSLGIAFIVRLRELDSKVIQKVDSLSGSVTLPKKPNPTAYHTLL